MKTLFVVQDNKSMLAFAKKHFEKPINKIL